MFADIRKFVEDNHGDQSQLIMLWEPVSFVEGGEDAAGTHDAFDRHPHGVVSFAGRGAAAEGA
jgi:hypothetical protein